MRTLRRSSRESKLVEVVAWLQRCQSRYVTGVSGDVTPVGDVFETVSYSRVQLHVVLVDLARIDLMTRGRRRPVVRRLGGGVDDDIDLVGVLTDELVETVSVANVEVDRRKGVVRRQEIPRDRSIRCVLAEKPCSLSFSTPTRSATIAEPINPPEPVTIAVGTGHIGGRITSPRRG